MQDEEYFKDWPNSYYQLNDARKKERLLKKHIDLYQLDDDKERLLIFQKRYKRIHGNYVDQFFQSFLSLQTMWNNKINALNRKKYNEQMVIDLMNLCLYDDITELLKVEYQYFIEEYIEASFRSFSRPAFLGMAQRTDEVTWSCVEENINNILVKFPHMFLLEDKCKILFDIAKEQINKIENKE